MDYLDTILFLLSVAAVVFGPWLWLKGLRYELNRVDELGKRAIEKLKKKTLP